MTVAPPADRRFRRPRVRPAAAPQRWAWRTVVRSGAALVLLAGALTIPAAVLPTSGTFAVQHVEVMGYQWMTTGEVFALLDDLHGADLVTADLDRWRQRLLASPWVAEASLRRTFPGTVTVMLTERQPVAMARLGADLYLIDRAALLIDRFGPAYAALDLPVVDGLAVRAESGTTQIDGRRAALAVRLLAALEDRPDLASRVSQIDVSDPGDAALLLKDQTARVRVGDERFAERLQAWVELAGVLHGEIPDIDYVDLRFDDRVYVKPLALPSPARPPAGTAGPARGGRG